MSHLFQPSRDCICCGRGAKPRDPSPERLNIIGISLSIYFRGQGKGSINPAGKIQICTECLTRALAGKGLFEGREARQFLAAIRERLSARYSDLLRQDAEVLPSYASRNSRDLASEPFKEGQ